MKTALCLLNNNIVVLFFFSDLCHTHLHDLSAVVALVVFYRCSKQ